MEGHVYERGCQINDWFFMLVGKIEEKIGTKFGFGLSKIGWGTIKNKTIFPRHNPYLNCTGGSGNYQWSFEPTITIEVNKMICEVLVPRPFYDQLIIGDKLRIEYQISWSRTRIKARVILY